MATIERISGTRGVTYKARVKYKGEARSKNFRRKSDAQTWASKLESELRLGRTLPAVNKTLADAIDRYLEETLPNKQRNKDAVNRRRHLLWWREQLSKVRLLSLDSDRITRVRDKLKRGKTRRGNRRSEGTCNRYLVSLAHCLSVATRQWKWLEKNPATDVAQLKEPRGRVRFLSDDERKRLLEACQESGAEHLYPQVVLALSTGMRQGEIVNLRWPDVDLKKGRIVLHDTKNDERRTVPLTGQALSLMRAAAKVRRIDNDHCFPGDKPGRPTQSRAAWYKALRRAQIDDFRFHDLRHSAASYLAMNGATLAEIAEILGHKTLAMARRYSHLTEDYKSSVVARMNREIFR